MYAFVRRLDRETLVVALNVGETSATVNLPLKDFVPDGSKLRAVLGTGDGQVQFGEMIGATIPGREGVVWEVETAGAPQ